MALQQTEAANKDPEPAKDAGPATATNNPAVASGDAGEAAATLAAHPEQRDALIRALHAQHGNAFVGQVLAASTSVAAPVKSKGEPDAEDASGLPGPMGSRFAGDGMLGRVERGSKDLKSGDTGPAVRKVQVALGELNFGPLAVTGTFDAATEAAVVAYQKARKLPRTDGILDDATFIKLEKEFTPDHYARMGEQAPPGMAGNPKWGDAKNPPKVLMTGTHELSADEKAEANSVISPAKSGPPIGTFHESVGEGTDNMYGPKILAAMQEMIDSKYGFAKSKKGAHDDGDTFSMDSIVKLGNAAKGEVDKVFGSWATGPEMQNNKTIKDRFTYERDKQSTMDADQKHDAALQRATYLLNTEGVFSHIDQEHSADRTRSPESGILKTVLEIIVKDNRDKLLLIVATSAAATQRDGLIKIQRMKKGGDPDEELWDKFGSMVHEYLHSLTHRRWHAYRDSKKESDPQAADALAEGVTEFLTRAVMSQINPNDQKLHKAVIGHESEDEANLDRSEHYDSEYARAHALAGVVGSQNLYAAYFLGQTKLVGA